MVMRRAVVRAGLAGALAVALGMAGPAAAADSDSAMPTQPWFLRSGLVLAEDLAAATARGQRFVIVWEQRGCSYCRDLHRVTLADPAIAAYVRAHFAVLSLNLRGSRRVTDFDGESLEERALARKWAITLTPTFQFLPGDPGLLAGRPIAAAESARVRGLLAPADFLAVFRAVRGDG